MVKCKFCDQKINRSKIITARWGIIELEEKRGLIIKRIEIVFCFNHRQAAMDELKETLMGEKLWKQ